MKFIKLILCCLCIFIITGCTKEYKLYIGDNKIVETFHMVIEDDNKYSYSPDGDFYPLHNDFNHKYKKKLKKEKGKSILDLEYKYSLDDFVNANSLNQCFDEKQIINNLSYYEIKLGKPNGCMFQEDYVINIITRNEVVDNNADIIKGNRYTWHVDNKENSDFKLVFKIKKGTAKTIFEENKIYIFIGLTLFATLVIITLIFIIRRIRKNQKV